MANLSYLSYQLLPTVFNMSVTASVVIIVLITFKVACKGLSSINKKIPATVFYTLWAVVLFRLLCPFSLTSESSFFSQYDSPIARTSENISVMEYVPTDIVHTEYPAVDLPVGFVNHIVNYYLPQGEEQLRADPLEAPVAIATNLWFVGILAMAIYGLHSYLALRKKLVGALRLKDNIYICDYITSPFVIGVIKPKIYLPSTLNEKEMIYVTAHEQHHIKRFDHIFKLLGFAALSIHWFNPLIWLAFELAMRDMEMSCDESVVKKLGEDIRGDYSQSLLNFATGRHIFAGTPLAFGEGDTQVRIKNLYANKKPNVVYTVIVAVLAAVLAFELMLNPDTSKGQILYNGMIYQQSGSPLITIPGERSINIGNLGEIVDKNAELTIELSGKNIDEIYGHLPIFQNEENPETIFLTTGEGWVPFTAASMVYDTTESWIKPTFRDGSVVNFTINLTDDVYWYGIYEDVYQNGKLISSGPVVYSSRDDWEDEENWAGTKEYSIAGLATVTAHDGMAIAVDSENGMENLTFEYRETEHIIGRRKIALPDAKYIGMGIQAAFNKDTKTFKLLSNDSFDLLAVSLATEENGPIYADYKNPNQAAVVVYRFVTSSIPLS